MATCDHIRKQASFKVVYCGATLSGKTTNLIYVHKKLDPYFRGNLVSLSSRSGRTLYFDFLRVNAEETSGYKTRFHLYTVPGEPHQTKARKVVLQETDGIIFVVDSQPERMEANLEALKSTREALEINGIDPESVPMVFQFNKRDCHGALDPELIDEALDISAPSFLASATTGHQVFATLDGLTQIIINNFHSSTVKGPERIEEENVASSSKMALSR